MPSHPSSRFVPSGSGHSRIPREDRVKQPLMVPAQPGALGTGLSLPELPKPWFGTSTRNDPGQGVPILPLILIMLLGCPVAIARATVTGHSLPGVRHLRDGPVPSAGDGAQVGDLDPPLCSAAGFGHQDAQNSPKRGEKYSVESIGVVSGAFLPIGSASPVSAVCGVAFPCPLVSVKHR